MSIIEVKVPDIGDFSEVTVIEVLVKPGDTLKVEQSLITVESDKASMECDVLVLGGGPGGYSAAFRAADLGLKVVWSSATPPWAACA
jgi:ribulose 1,5-bisphosphate synthetase/thiazole synthase